MEIIQTIDFTNPFFVAIACSLLCVVGILGFVLLQILGFGLSILAGLLELIVGVFTGGPIAWCGCFLMVGVVGACCILTLGIALLAPSCGTPDAVNLCRLLGY